MTNCAFTIKEITRVLSPFRLQYSVVSSFLLHDIPNPYPSVPSLLAIFTVQFQSTCIIEGELLVWNDNSEQIKPFRKIRKDVLRAGRRLKCTLYFILRAPVIPLNSKMRLFRLFTRANVFLTAVSSDCAAAANICRRSRSL
jgi:hypothetical protein